MGKLLVDIENRRKLSPTAQGVRYQTTGDNNNLLRQPIGWRNTLHNSPLILLHKGLMSLNSLLLLYVGNGVKLRLNYIYNPPYTPC